MTRPERTRRWARCAAAWLAAWLGGCADSGGAAPGSETGGATGTQTESGSGTQGAADSDGGGSTAVASDSSSGQPDPPFTACEGDSEAHAVFNKFWRVLDKNYALFDIRLAGETWDAVGWQECAAIRADMSADELFDVLIATAEHLDDGHVQLEAADIGRDGDGWVNEYPHYEELYELEINVEDNYLDGALTWAAEDWFAWGTIGDVGYVSITSMDSLSPSGDEDDDVAAADAAMTAVMADLSGSTAIVVDVRANEGGWDAVALAIARWFAGPRTVAWSEQVRDGPEHTDFSDWEDTYVEASTAEGYGGPVIVLTSGGTFSAAEVYLLAMRVRDNATVLGEVGSGHLSDIYDASLPNGWDFVYSGERYRAADGEIYEAIGIPVDVEVAFDVTAFGSGTDVMLEAALSEL